MVLDDEICEYLEYGFWCKSKKEACIFDDDSLELCRIFIDTKKDDNLHGGEHCEGIL